MQKCKYSDITKCQECSVLYHKQCKLFLKEHYKSLGHSLFPFKFTNLSPTTAFSNDIDKAKSNALLLAIRINSPVKKMSLSQVLSAVISNIEIEAPVIYIEYDKKAQGDPDKVASCLTSFIEQQTLRGAQFSIYISPNVRCNLDIPKL